MKIGPPWSTAIRVAGRLTGKYPLATSYHWAVLEDQLPDLIDRAAELVAEETGLAAPSPPRVELVDRRAWVERNILFFARLIEPVRADLRRGGDRLMAVETGAMLGVLSRRVLGQYELVLPSGNEGDTIYLVAPNLLAMERNHQFRPDEFRFWVALHECTHRLQFTGIPWLRDHFLELIGDLVASARPEPGRWARMVDEVRSAVLSGRPVLDESGLLGLFATPGQRELIGRVQALMSVLEGHGHVVMDRVGGRELTSQRRMSAVLQQRRNDPRTAAFFRLTGLELKLRQYELGRRFITEVEKTVGWTVLDRVWEGPDMLPTLAEIEEPSRWIKRAV